PIMSADERAAIEEAVEEANATFYRAIEIRSIELMGEVWAHEEWVRCVHPGWDLITGWRRVRESWMSIFEGDQNLRISPSFVDVNYLGDVAWVSCTEDIIASYETSIESAQATSTNLFVKRQSRWLLVHHHSSAIPLIIPHDLADIIQ
ncbi:MAG TPA: nuclear transport factor 2 family protein, partial [Blastocatellia bacterium]|nr:nuclear transport factor 2 family protein [Blastocatellia bacterium]